MSDTDAPDRPAPRPRKKPARKSAAKKTSKAAGKTQAAAKPAGTAAERAGSAQPSAAPSATAGDDRPQPLIRVPMPVRWRDLDAFNHVNNSKYLSYLEEARLHWMIGVPGQGLDEHVAPVVAAAQLNYRRPIAWPARIVVELFVERLGNTSLTIGHRIVAEDDPDTLYCDGHVIMVWIDHETGAAAALPQRVREACA